MCTLINRYIVRMLNLIFSKSIDSEIFTVMMKCPFKEQEKEHIKKYLSEEDVVKYESVFQIYNMLIDKEYPKMCIRDSHCTAGIIKNVHYRTTSKGICS